MSKVLSSWSGSERTQSLLVNTVLFIWLTTLVSRYLSKSDGLRSSIERQFGFFACLLIEFFSVNSWYINFKHQPAWETTVSTCKIPYNHTMFSILGVGFVAITVAFSWFVFIRRQPFSSAWLSSVGAIYDYLFDWMIIWLDTTMALIPPTRRKLGSLKLRTH